jgi:hypothetical protein
VPSDVLKLHSMGESVGEMLMSRGTSELVVDKLVQASKR